MPVDRNVDDEEEQDDEEARDQGAANGIKRRFKEFECPDCSANNPIDEGFGNGDEITCNYCGTEYKAVINEDGKLKLKST